MRAAFNLIAAWNVRLGLSAICIDAHKTLSARLNKSNSADAEGLAQLARMNYFTPVHKGDRGVSDQLLRWIA